MYCKSLFNYSRFPSPTIKVGDLNLGASEPIRIQTMTNTLLSETQKTTEQVISCFEKGADMVRISVPSIKDIEHLKDVMINIKKIIIDKPIIADIHFNPKIALAACQFVDKIRVNPGNFVIINKNQEIYNEIKYKKELKEIEQKFGELLDKCKISNKTIRIGTNHGSLSKRIITKYGNTAKGLVQATMEYLEICKNKNFDNIVVSIKASNPTIMVMANRLLAEEMQKKQMIYPIHLGVTEAGSGLEGRIKSAIGIGALLVDGIGDTIRVSLTEAPEKELPVALTIINHIKKIANSPKLPESNVKFFDPFSFQRRKTYKINNIGGNSAPIVILNSFNQEIYFDKFLPDYVICSQSQSADPWLNNITAIVDIREWDENSKNIPLMSIENYMAFDKKEQPCFVKAHFEELNKNLINKIEKNKNAIFVAEAYSDNKIGELRMFFAKLKQYNSTAPVIIKLNYTTDDINTLAIDAAIDSSVFFIDGLADGIYIDDEKINEKEAITDISFEILQSSHRRLVKTEFISCPSCGRTNFDIEEVTDKIKKTMSHLKGIKIAVMGCIVNGPGEIADADYGYIGSGKHKVSLYKGKNLVKKNIPDTIAVEELKKLIKENGDWIEA